jgi:hypothetical protein
MTGYWRGYFGGNPGTDVRNTVSLMVPDGKQPNWFHRWMQYLVLGIYWRWEERSR